MNSLYCDGGVMSYVDKVTGKRHSNPSRLGGTWAWRRIEGDGLKQTKSRGILIPATNENTAFEEPLFSVPGTTHISNNNTEVYAILDALCYIPNNGQEYTLYSDSQLALGFIFGKYKQDSIPEWLRQGIKEVRSLSKFAQVTGTVLLSGHPKIIRDKVSGEVVNLISKRAHLPASIHNVWCDEACQGVGCRYKEIYGDTV